MSKPIKNLLTKDYTERFGESDGVVVINVRGLGADDTIAMRSALAEKGIRVTVVKNSLAARATEGTGLEPVKDLLDGACAFAYSADLENGSVVNVARDLLKQKKEMGFIEVRGAVLDGSLFGDAKAVEALSKYPTREEAIAKLAGALLGPAATLSKTLDDQAGQFSAVLRGPASTMASLLKAIEEKGGEVKKVA